MKTNDEESITRLQNQINRLIHSNQVNAVKNEKNGSKKWWSKVNSMTGRKGNTLPVSSIIEPSVINTYFQGINTDPEYTAPQLLSIPKDTRIPSLSLDMGHNFLRKLKRTTSGPDDIPYWFWKTYAEILTPVITSIFNTSLKSGKIPNVWKRADVIPSPKENSINSCSQLRPISLTDIIMRLFEKCVYQSEVADTVYNYIGDDQFAYKKGHNSTMALIKYQHMWLKSLDEGAKSVRVISFDFSKAFDSVPHDILFNKIKKIPINPYIINWMIDFLDNRRQRVKVDGVTTEFLDINHGVPQGTVLGPVMFTIMVNDIKAVSLSNDLSKFADDIAIIAPVYDYEDSAGDEVENMKLWSNENRMSLNMEKTYEMIVRGKVSTPLPDHIPSIERKEWLKLLGVTMEDIPGKWDKHFEEMMKKASRRMYILRVCKHYGLSTHQSSLLFFSMDLLFNSLIVSLFTFAVEVRGGASYNKYVSQIDKFVNRAYRNGYTSNRSDFKATISNRDKKLWSRIINDDKNALRNLLPSKLNRPLRRRGHDFELPIIKTERFKNAFINRCLFNFI